MEETKIFTKDSVDEFALKLKNSLKVPFISMRKSSLGGRTTLLLAIGFEKKENWINGIFENSKYARFSIEENGIVECFTISHNLNKKFRKSKVKSFEKLKERLNKFILN